MTPDQMDQLDRALAEKLMGWHDSIEEWFGGFDTHVIGVYRDAKKRIVANPYSSWSPTRNISQALGDGGEGTVVGEMKKKDWSYNVQSMFEEKPDKHGCLFFHKNTHDSRYAHASTPSLAICLATAKALGINVEDLP